MALLLRLPMIVDALLTSARIAISDIDPRMLMPQESRQQAAHVAEECHTAYDRIVFF